MPTTQSISVHFAQAVCNSAARIGLPLAPLLGQAGLGQQVIENDRSRISPQQLANLMRALWRACGDELLGLASEPSKFGVFSLMAKQVVLCKNLREVLQQSCHFYNLVTNAIVLRFEENGQDAHITISLTDPSCDPDHLLIEYLLLIWHRFPNWLIGEKIPLHRVTLQHSTPKHVAEYRFLFPCPYECDQAENSLQFDSLWLDRPVVENPKSLCTYLARTPQDWFIKQAFYPQVTRQVVECFERAPPESLPSVDNVARQLHMSVRSLRRKLDCEGSSFQQIKNDIRRDQAIHLLSNHKISVGGVGQALGFTESATFIRAFKDWTGLPPGAYRNKSLPRI